MGGGEQKRPWVLGNLIYKTVKLGRLERSMWKPVFSFFTSFHHPNNRLKIPLFFAPLHINSKKKKKRKKLLFGTKIWDGHLTLLNTPSYACEPLNRRVVGLQDRSGYFGKDKNSYPCRKFEQRFHSFSATSLVTIAYRLRCLGCHTSMKSLGTVTAIPKISCNKNVYKKYRSSYKLKQEQ